MILVPKLPRPRHAAKAVIHFLLALLVFIFLVGETSKGLWIFGFVAGSANLLVAAVHAACACSNE